MIIYKISHAKILPTFRATSKDSRIDFHKNSDLSNADITCLDSKVLVGRAPGEPKYLSFSNYVFDTDTLMRDLEYLKTHKKVGTIFDLRNPKYEGQSCIDAERFECKKHNIDYINFKMDAAIVPTDNELTIFFNTIKNTDKNVYIHCHAGKDRTGLLASCYLAKQYGLNKEEIFKKVFDARQNQRLYYMLGHPDECEKFYKLLKALAKK